MWGLVAQTRVETLGIVAQFDIVGNVALGVLAGGIHGAVDVFVLQCGEEQFPILFLQFAQSRSFRHRQRWLPLGMRRPILVDPVPQALLIHTLLAGNRRHWAGRIYHHFRRLLLVLGVYDRRLFTTDVSSFGREP